MENDTFNQNISEAKENLEDLKTPSITIETLIGSLIIAGIVWVKWLLVFYLFLSR
ncbi:hypothetical protein RZN22_04335 [Bacillaceae bacterium S4-13-58]